MLAENKNSASLINILKTIKVQYSNMKIEQMKETIDKIMGANFVCLDGEQLGRGLEQFMIIFDKEVQTIANKKYARGTELLVDHSGRGRVKDAIFDGSQNHLSNNLTDLLKGAFASNQK